MAVNSFFSNQILQEQLLTLSYLFHYFVYMSNICRFFLFELQVWKFLVTFTDVLGLNGFTIDEFSQSLHDYVGHLTFIF